MATPQPQEHIILAIDTESEAEAARQVAIAKDLGAHMVKFGLGMTAAGWSTCSELAKRAGLVWYADAMLNAPPKIMGSAVHALTRLDYPPAGITVHTSAGNAALRRARENAAEAKLFGITVPDCLDPVEVTTMYRTTGSQKFGELAWAALHAGLDGLVASPFEVGAIKRLPITSGLITMSSDRQRPADSPLVTMVTGLRSPSDNSVEGFRENTPGAAISAGADLVVVGPQVFRAEDPGAAYEKLLTEVAASLPGRPAA